MYDHIDHPVLVYENDAKSITITFDNFIKMCLSTGTYLWFGFGNRRWHRFRVPRALLNVGVGNLREGLAAVDGLEGAPQVQDVDLVLLVNAVLAQNSNVRPTRVLKTQTLPNLGI